MGVMLNIHFITLMLLLLPLSLSAGSTHPVHVDSEAEIRDIQYLDARVEDLYTKMEQCVAADIAPVMECHCQYPGKLARVRDALENIIAKHPGWENRAVLWWDGRHPANLNLAGLTNRITRPCQELLTVR